MRVALTSQCLIVAAMWLVATPRQVAADVLLDRLNEPLDVRLEVG